MYTQIASSSWLEGLGYVCEPIKHLRCIRHQCILSTETAICQVNRFLDLDDNKSHYWSKIVWFKLTNFILIRINKLGGVSGEILNPKYLPPFAMDNSDLKIHEDLGNSSSASSSSSSSDSDDAILNLLVGAVQGRIKLANCEKIPCDTSALRGNMYAQELLGRSPGRL